MKQRLTVKQLNKLSEKGKEGLRKWCCAALRIDSGSAACPSTDRESSGRRRWGQYPATMNSVNILRITAVASLYILLPISDTVELS